MSCLPAGSLLLRLGAQLSCWLLQDGSLGNDNNVLAAELLLQLTNDAILDFLESLQLRNRHVDDDGLLASHVDLLGAGDVKLTELSLQIAVHLKVKKSL